jgi:hypothetical protein
VAHVLDPIGVTLVVIEGSTARDAAAQVAATVDASGEVLRGDDRVRAPLGSMRLPLPVQRAI